MRPPDDVVKRFAEWLGFRFSTDYTEREWVDRLMRERGLTEEEARRCWEVAYDEALDDYFSSRFGIVGRNEEPPESS